MADNQASQSLNEPDRLRRPARLALYVGAVLIAGGLLAIYFGYDGAAKNPLTQAQMPYVISGGLLGLGLMALGAVTVAVYVILQVQGDLRSELTAIRDSVDRLGDTLSLSVVSGGAASHTTSNGTVMVARGAASYHRADCRLVTRAEAVTPLPRAEADRTGLAPCRICNP